MSTILQFGYNIQGMEHLFTILQFGYDCRGMEHFSSLICWFETAPIPHYYHSYKCSMHRCI